MTRPRRNTTKALPMRLDVAADTGSAELDPKALRRMLDAPLDNAIKFNREGGTVAVRARRHDGGLEIAVADTGPGIVRENLAKIFKPLSQLDAGLAHAPDLVLMDVQMPGMDGVAALLEGRNA